MSAVVHFFRRGPLVLRLAVPPEMGNGGTASSMTDWMETQIHCRALENVKRGQRHSLDQCDTRYVNGPIKMAVKKKSTASGTLVENRLTPTPALKFYSTCPKFVRLYLHSPPLLCVADLENLN